MAISAVINTRNEEDHIEACLQALDWADEIVVYDADSTDRTREIAAKYTDKIFVHHDKSGYVEPQRNGAIEKASHDWILIVDADEIVPQTLAEKLKQIAKSDSDVSHVQIPRKNIIFGKYIEHTGWWPDYQTRFFKKGSVTWTGEIHIPPEAEGKAEKLPAEVQFALLHHNYNSISDYLTRLNRYTDIQAKEIIASDYVFAWTDLLTKPHNEFLSRFFVAQGYKDGLHGLVLSILQAFSFFVVYLKIWEHQKFVEVNSKDFLQDVQKEGKNIVKEVAYWYTQVVSKGVVKKYIRKVLRH